MATKRHNRAIMSYGLRTRRMPKRATIKARVDEGTKGQVNRIAFERNLDESDIVRLAVMDFINRDLAAKGPTLA